MPLEELIKGIAVVSGNDAAVAAAEHLSGNVENFVAKMNIKARELGMANSEFMTPNGLPAKGSGHDGTGFGQAFLVLYSTLSRGASHSFDDFIHLQQLLSPQRQSTARNLPGCRRHQDRVRLRLGVQPFSNRQARRCAPDRRSNGGTQLPGYELLKRKSFWKRAFRRWLQIREMAEPSRRSWPNANLR